MFHFCGGVDTSGLHPKQKLSKIINVLRNIVRSAHTFDLVQIIIDPEGIGPSSYPYKESALTIKLRVVLMIRMIRQIGKVGSLTSGGLLPVVARPSQSQYHIG